MEDKYTVLLLLYIINLGCTERKRERERERDVPKSNGFCCNSLYQWGSCPGYI